MEIFIVVCMGVWLLLAGLTFLIGAKKIEEEE